MVSKDRYGVHQTHCCVMHGCKYGNSDCPVVTGEIVQEYPCEDCPSDYKPGISHNFNVEQEVFDYLQQNTVSYLPYKITDLNVNKGEMVVFCSPNGAKLPKVISHVQYNHPLVKMDCAIMSFYSDHYSNYYGY